MSGVREPILELFDLLALVQENIADRPTTDGRLMTIARKVLAAVGLRSADLTAAHFVNRSALSPETVRPPFIENGHALGGCQREGEVAPSLGSAVVY
jgi:hypothetical protein